MNNAIVHESAFAFDGGAETERLRWNDSIRDLIAKWELRVKEHEFVGEIINDLEELIEF